MGTTTATRWTVELTFEEDPDHTVAIARLTLPHGEELTGRGIARRNPADRPVVTIGEEVAGARALSELAHTLLDYSADEIQENVRKRPPVL